MYRSTSTPRHHKVLRSLALASLSLSLVGGLAACGDDDDTAGADTPTTVAAVDGPDTADPTLPTRSPDYVPTADPTIGDDVCDAWTAGMGAVHQAPQDPGADMGAYLEAEVLPHTATLVDTVDEDLVAAARTIDDTFRQMASSGDLSGMESPQLAEAQATVGGALHIGCDWAAVTIQADEYVFEQVPTSLGAGRYSFALENVGVEDHEMVLFRRNDGVTESFEELAEMGDAMMEKVEFTGVAFGGPGTTAYSAVDLEPGTYFLVCFIPSGGEDGPPHFVQGMQTTLTVA